MESSASSQAISLEGEGQLSGVGEDSDGYAFVSIAYNTQKLEGRAFDARLVSKKGQTIERSGLSTSGFNESGLMVEKYTFRSPLSDVEKFIVGTRPYQTNIWHAVPMLKGTK